MELVIQSLIEAIKTLMGIIPLQCETNINSNYNASISIQDEVYYFSLDASFLDLLAQAFMLATPLSQAEKEDLTREFANLIVGKAKALSNDSQLMLGTPIFLAQLPAHLTQGAHFQIQDGQCSLYKE